VEPPLSHPRQGNRRRSTAAGPGLGLGQRLGMRRGEGLSRLGRRTQTRTPSADYPLERKEFTAGDSLGFLGFPKFK